MKQFRYRLERVLQYRNIVKAERQRELQLRMGELHAAEQRLSDLQTELVEREAIDQGEHTGSMIAMAGNYEQRLRREIGETHEVILMKQVVVEEALNEYIEASKDARALELHKDDKLKEYVEETEREEGKFLDELTIQRMRLKEGL